MSFKSLKNNKNSFFEGPIIFDPKLFIDSRGCFFESWNKKIFEQTLGYKVEFVQDNISISKKGVLRGIHYQLPQMEQGKLVRCLKGSLLDVVVDLRKSSKTFKSWGSIELNSLNKYQMWIPPGFGHGFLSLEDETLLEYKVSNYWSPDHEKTLIWDDQEININWPNISTQFNLSNKDLIGKTLEELNTSNELFL